MPGARPARPDRDRFPIIGHAIVSADGMIADAAGEMPPELRNDADFALFQAALDQASVVVLGSIGHRRHPNPGRRRLVFTSRVTKLTADEADPLAAFCNPGTMVLGNVLREMDVADGVIAVTGGRMVFDHFLPLFDEFLLAEANGFVLPGGIQCFSGAHPREALARSGLEPAETRTIDAANQVTLTRWVLRTRGPSRTG